MRHRSPLQRFNHARQQPLVGQAPARVFVAVALYVASAPGMPSGIATPNCNGCHQGDAYQGELALFPSAALVPGEATEFTLRITERDMQVAGYFVTTTDGTWTAGAGNRVLGDGIVHSRPVAATAGVAEVTFKWTPPVEPGGADIGVYVVAANDDGSQLGDRPAAAVFSYVWGCEGVDLYEDIDGDGFGFENGAWSLGCEAREGWSTRAGDCNDLWASIYPGAQETADGRDEDCDGEVDEGIVITTWYIDEDGDGFGYGISVESDVAPMGYVGNRGDCDDQDAAISPLAIEVCDGRDNDCNQKLDDGAGVFETCGVGLCTRVLEVCDRECVPGAPSAELCNGLDDDCDGEADEDATCPDGLVCFDSTCVAPSAETEEESGVEQSGTDVLRDPPTHSSLAPTASGPGAEPTVASNPTTEEGASTTPPSSVVYAAHTADDSVPGAQKGCSIARPTGSDAAGCLCCIVTGLIGVAYESRRRRLKRRAA